MSTDALGDLERLLREQDEPQLNPEEYKQVFRRHPAGVAVVTLAGPEGPVGFTATSVISVSADPPLLGFVIASTSSSWPAVRSASTVAVNFLGAGSRALSQRFATRGVDRFDGAAWTALPTGEPIFDEATTWVRGRVMQRIPAGDSYLVTLRALTSGAPRAGAPLVYHDRSYHHIGGHSELE
ncbi:MAG: flavin reductase family protein [Actinomycetales bacterium]|nr:flavin reductase family protein [Actinomycetales bacterium]